MNFDFLQNLKIFNTSDANSRTIVADAYKIGSEGDTLYFYLYGNAQSGQELTPKIVTVTSSDGIHGKVTLDIDCYNWELTLVACETDGLSTEAQILADAVLIGYANVDMMFTNEIKFTLSPKGLTKKGTVKLDLSLDGDWPIPEGYVAKANIFQLKDGEPLTGVEQTIADMAASPTTNSFGTAGNYTANGIMYKLSEDTSDGTTTIGYNAASNGYKSAGTLSGSSGGFISSADLNADGTFDKYETCQ